MSRIRWVTHLLAGAVVVASSIVAQVPVAQADTQYYIVVSLSGSGEGQVTDANDYIECPHDCVQDYDAGSVVTLRENNFPDSLFGGWSGDCSGSALTCTLTMTQNYRVTADFETGETVGVEYQKNGSGFGAINQLDPACDGGVCNGAASNYAVGSTVTVEADPNEGSYFAGWSGGTCAGYTDTCTFTADKDRRVVATFNTGTPPPSYPLQVQVNGPGTGTVQSTDTLISCPGACEQDYPSGTSVTLVPQSSGDNAFAGWTSGPCTGAGDCTLSITQATSVTGSFKELSPTVTVTVSKGGTGSGSVHGTITCDVKCRSAHATVARGAQVTITATPATGSAFAGWTTPPCRGSDATCTFTAGGDSTTAPIFNLVGLPSTKITNELSDSKRHSIRFGFRSNVAQATFQCWLGRASTRHRSFTNCSSPKRYKELSAGSYQFAVRAVDANGHDPSPATYRFKIHNKN